MQHSKLLHYTQRNAIEMLAVWHRKWRRMFNPLGLKEAGILTARLNTSLGQEIKNVVFSWNCKGGGRLTKNNLPELDFAQDIRISTLAFAKSASRSWILNSGQDLGFKPLPKDDLTSSTVPRTPCWGSDSLLTQREDCHILNHQCCFLQYQGINPSVSGALVFWPDSFLYNSNYILRP